jgi:hypothetical protein
MSLHKRGTLGDGVPDQNCSRWQKITSELGFAARAADTSDTAPSLAPFLPYLFSKVFGYPAGGRSAAIRCTILPKSRRARWLSANSSQQ